jgi:hypothetical protein
MSRFSSKLHKFSASWMIFPLASALAIIGARIWLIADYGSPTPYWDQWSAEGMFLYPKYFNGTLSFADLIALHNEHRILVTRLWSLMLIDLGGYWDPILQMLANTVIIGAFVALLVAAFRPILDRASWIMLALFTAVLYALPFGWESTLAGFHSQWYFMLLFSLAGMLAIIKAAAFTLNWWLATLLLVTSYFSMAAGALTTAAAFAFCALQFFVGHRFGWREALALAILAAMTALMVLFIPAYPAYAAFKAHSIGQFLHSMLEIMSFPAAPSNASPAVLIVCAILVQAPAALTCIRIIWLRPPLTDSRWRLVAIAFWAILQAACLAYGRAPGALWPRYLDVYLVGVVLNCACLFYALNTSAIPRLRHWRRLGIALWLLLVLFGSAKTIFTQSLAGIAERVAHTRAETVNMQNFLATGDLKALQKKAFADIPYWNPEQLARIASQPVIRGLLPPALVGEASAERAQQHGLAQFTGRTIEALKQYALRWGGLLIPAGLTLFLIGLLGLTNQQPKITEFSSAPE